MQENTAHVLVAAGMLGVADIHVHAEIPEAAAAPGVAALRDP